MRTTMIRIALVGGLALATLLSGSAGACGWEQTCNTEEWLKGELSQWLP